MRLLNDMFLTGCADLVYTFRYIHKKTTGSNTSWVIRQTGVYQKIDLATGHSCSIMLQPSQRLSGYLRKMLMTSTLTSQGLVTAPMYMHRLVLTTALDNTGEYAEHLHSQLTEMVCLKVIVV